MRTVYTENEEVLSSTTESTSFSWRHIVFRRRNRAANRARMRVAPGGIDEARFVPIGGLDQWISIRGDDRNNPALLIIHGGPGGTTSIFAPQLRSWERHFTVVQWDQRGAGKTFGRHGAKATGALSLEGLAADGVFVAEYVAQYLGQRQLLVLGSSAGSCIALTMVRRRPDLFLAYVGTDQNVGGDREGLGLGLAVAALKRAGRERDATRLQAMGADPAQWTTAMVDKRNRIIASADGGAPNMITDVTLPALFSSPQHGWRDILDMARGQKFSSEQLGLAVAHFDARAGSMRLELPMIVLHGALDLVTPVELARRFVDEVDAPHKVFSTVEGGGHLVAFAQPEQFLALLLRALEPQPPRAPLSRARGVR